MHTKGPWSHGECTPSNQIILPKTFQCIYVPGNSMMFVTGEDIEDNARLIAAAPDLLEAAKDALESLRRLSDTDGAYRVTNISQLQAAIAKAGG